MGDSATALGDKQGLAERPVLIRGDRFDAVEVAASVDGSLYVQVYDRGDGVSGAQALVWVDSAGGAHFLGGCAPRQWTEPFAEFADALGWADTGESLLLDLIANGPTRVQLSGWSAGEPITKVATERPGETTVIGRAITVTKYESFSAYRPYQDQLINVGPMTVTIEGHGNVFVPADTTITEQCLELDLELVGEQPNPGPSCYFRADFDEHGQLTDLIVLGLTFIGDPGVARVTTSGFVIGGTSDTVTVRDGRDLPVVWPLDPDTAFRCGNELWTPPVYPSVATGATEFRYLLVIDTEADTVTDMRCATGF